MIYLVAAVFLAQAAPVQPQPDTPTVAAVETSATGQVASPVVEEPRPAERRRARVANNVICEDRAPTGSTLRRNICRTPNRAQAEARIAREYVSEVTNAAHEVLRP